jgi:hypothetical protein
MVRSSEIRKTLSAIPNIKHITPKVPGYWSSSSSPDLLLIIFAALSSPSIVLEGFSDVINPMFPLCSSGPVIVVVLPSPEPALIRFIFSYSLLAVQLSRGFIGTDAGGNPEGSQIFVFFVKLSPGLCIRWDSKLLESGRYALGPRLEVDLLLVGVDFLEPMEECDARWRIPGLAASMTS